MTKEELIRFLEPFSDEIQILYVDYENGEQELNPKYIIARDRGSLKVEFGIEQLEGYIEL